MKSTRNTVKYMHGDTITQRTCLSTTARNTDGNAHGWLTLREETC